MRQPKDKRACYRHYRSANRLRLVSLLCCLLCLAFNACTNVSAEELASGWRPPSAAELQYFAKTAKRVHYVRPNALAMMRINGERLAKGLPLVKNVSVADSPEAEIVGAVDEQLLLTGVPSVEPLVQKSLTVKAPAVVDNSALDCFPPVRSQGSIGSCSCFSATYYTMTHNVGYARGTINDVNGDDTTRFSPKFSYNMINGGQDAGSSVSGCYSLLQRHGSISWADFPYETTNQPYSFREWCLDEAAWKRAISYRMGSASYIYNVDDDGSSVEDLKMYLANGWICNYSTYIHEWLYKTVADDPNTAADDAYVGQHICYVHENGTNGGHAMTIVGYNDHIWCDINENGSIDAGEKGAWKIVNSWGNWKNGGFCWLAYDAVRAVSLVPGGPTDRYPSGAFRSGRIYQLAPGPADYQPKLLARFTVNHAERYQMNINLGIADTTESVPTSTFYPTGLTGDGGAYAFDGTNTACDGTFWLDFTDLVPSGSTNKRYFLRLYDSASAGALQAKNYRIVDDIHVISKDCTQSFPVNTNGNTVYRYVDYNMQNGLSPTAAFSATPASGNEPLTVQFNASASNDPDGNIVAYRWDFGDGGSAQGRNTSHLFAEGNYTVELTVEDNDGNEATATKVITVGPDPNKIVSPNSLAVSAVAPGAVTLTWNDRSDNETGFVVEGAANTSPVGNWTVVGTVGANQEHWTGPIADGHWRCRVRARNTTTGYFSPYSNQVTVTTGGRGGAVCCRGTGRVTLAGCHFDDVDGGRGGSLYADDDGDLTIINCTIAGGGATGDGGALCLAGRASAAVDNTVIWSTTSGGSGESVFVGASATLTVRYSDWPSGTFAGTGTTTVGAGCINVDPALGTDGRLGGSSPCIDAGRDDLVPATMTKDCAGENRFVGTVDMGAYERQP